MLVLMPEHRLTGSFSKIRSPLTVEKSSDADLLREMIGSADERLMELEVGGATGAVR